MERDVSRPNRQSTPQTAGDVFLSGMKAMHAPERPAPTKQAQAQGPAREHKQRQPTNNFFRLPKAERHDRLAAARAQVPERIIAPAIRTEAMAERLQAPRPALKQAQHLVKNAVAHRQGREVQGIKASPKTHAKYDSLAIQLARDGKTPEQAAATKASFFTYRAAVVRDATTSGQQAASDFAAAAKIERGLKQQAKTDKSPETRQRLLEVSARKAEAENRLKSAAKVLQRYKPGETNRAGNFGREGYQQIYKPDTERAQSTSKRVTEVALSRGWQDKIFNSAQRGDRPAVAVLSVTGARPTEVQKGVKIQRTDEGGLMLTIKGAKCDEFRGSPSREIVLTKEQVQVNKQASYLHNIAGDRGGTTVKTKDSETLSRRIASIGDKQGLDVSGYSFRHGFATDSRANGLTNKEIGQSMGHRDLRSTRNYGGR